ncbi:MAG: mercuric transporter MerT family protein [Alphaproteobacteria bacterium]|nr:mercuric transporter MerT family protein [Alphaproteobacteria bacterium]
MEEQNAGENKGRKGLFVAGGLLGAIAASSCCILPLVFFGLGVSGAWIGNLTALAPYQPIFVVVTLGFLGGGYWMVYRKPKQACVEGSYCAQPESGRIAKIGLWVATLLIAAAMAFPYVAPLILEKLT